MLEGWKPTLLFFSILESQVSTSYLTGALRQWQTPLPHRAGRHENVSLVFTTENKESKESLQPEVDASPALLSSTPTLNIWITAARFASLSQEVGMRLN